MAYQYAQNQILCVCVCVYTYRCVCVHMHVQLEVDITYLPQRLFALCLETCLSESVYTGCTASPEDSPVSSSPALGLHVCVIKPGFYVGAGVQTHVLMLV